MEKYLPKRRELSDKMDVLRNLQEEPGLCLIVQRIGAPASFQVYSHCLRGAAFFGHIGGLVRSAAAADHRRTFRSRQFLHDWLIWLGSNKLNPRPITSKSLFSRPVVNGTSSVHSRSFPLNL